MRAPHVDEYSDQTMKAHEYLVLKTGQADFHEHLDEPKPGDNEEEHRPVRKKAEAVRRTFGKDESPGFYGEVADYWRNFGNEQLTQSSAEEEDQVCYNINCKIKMLMKKCDLSEYNIRS